MHIQYKAITIRNAAAADAPQLAAWWNDGAVMVHAGFPRGLGTTPEEVAGKLARDSDDTTRRLMLLVEEKPIGEMDYHNRSRGTAEIDIKICDPSFQEKGIGRIALSLLIRWLFDHGCTKIVLDTNLDNTRAQHVYELLGFQKRQVRYNSWRDQLGQLQSSVDYELTRENFVNFAV